MFGYIYKITNNFNEKCYIGKHKYPKPELDPQYITSGTLIRRVIESHGIENFIISIVDTAETADELNALECKYIKEFHSMHPMGYNLTVGGDGLNNPTDEVRLKMSLKKLGSKQSDETKQKKNLKLKAVPHNNEWVKKISNSLTGHAPSDTCMKRNRECKSGSKWYHNDTEEHMFSKGSTIPEGYVAGRLKNPFPNQTGTHKSAETIIKITSKKSGACWYNNDISEIMCFPQNIPDGFSKGRLKKHQ